jgi:hypothetical protein
MPKAGRHKLRDLVPHPRYGDQLIPSGYKFTAEQVRNSFWGYHRANIFPETAIPADTSRQNFSTYPRAIYVDILRECRTCGKPFIFFAKEQKHWFEELKFFIDADCVHCPKCRATNQRCQRHFRRYGKLIERLDLTDKEFEVLIADTAFLAESRVIRDLNHLGRLRNIAKKRIPTSPALQDLSRAIAGLRKA